MPWPKVKGKPRSRTKKGRIRRKRKDTGKKRKKNKQNNEITLKNTILSKDDDKLFNETINHWKNFDKP